MSPINLGERDVAFVIRSAGNSEIYLPVIDGDQDIKGKFLSFILFWGSTHPTIEKVRSEVDQFIKEQGL
jgi:hypothetical protein